MNNNTEHPDIDAYLLGHLSPEARADFEAAMGQDEALTTAVEVRRLEFEVAEAIVAQDIRAQITALRAEDIRSKDTTTNPLPRWRYWWLGGVLLCLIVLFFRVNWPTASTGLPPEAPVPMPAPEVPNVVPPAKKTAPSSPDSSPEPRLQASARPIAMRLYQRPDLGVLRGNGETNDPLSAAVQAWEQKKYNQAIALCESISAQDPLYWRAQYIIAHSAFNQAHFQAAAARFSNISNSKAMPWAEESDWYGLLALLAANQQNTPAFERYWKKIERDSGHLYHKMLWQIEH